MHRVNGDGTERAVGDIHQAELELYNGRSGYGGMTALEAWGPDGAGNKEVVMWSEPCFRVLADGSVKIGHLPNAINLPLDQIETALPRHVKDKNQVLLLHCQSGMRSGVAKKKLNALGYSNAYNLGSYGRAAEIVGKR